MNKGEYWKILNILKNPTVKIHRDYNTKKPYCVSFVYGGDRYHLQFDTHKFKTSKLLLRERCIEEWKSRMIEKGYYEQAKG